MGKKNNHKSEKKIFHLGFSRSGALILTHTLEIAERKIAFKWIKTAKMCSMQPLAVVMYNNLVEKNEILLKDLKDYDGFFNLTYTIPKHAFRFNEYFKEFESQYPGTQFVITIRPVLEYILSEIYEHKTRKITTYNENFDTKNIINRINYYFQHCLNIREYFTQPHIKKRSELFVFNPNKITPEELLKKMKIYLYPNVKIDISEFSELSFDVEDYRLHINDKILKHIQENLQKYGDPSTFEWWNQK